MRHVSNIRSVLALGREYEFDSLFCIQPVPVVGKTLNLTEMAALAHHRKKNRWIHHELAYWEEHYDSYADGVVTRCAEDKYPIADLRSIFATEHEQVYIDDCHLNAKGYSMIAQRIAAELRDRQLVP